MRKTAAFLLFTTFGVYHLGYFAVQFLMPLAIHQHWENQIWGDQASSLPGRMVRVPFIIPYGQNQDEFQPVNFSMEIDGKMARVIKQRYFDDHLEVIVVDDQLQMNLNEQVKNWFFSLGAAPSDADGHPLQQVLLKSFEKNFVSYSLELEFLPVPWAILPAHSFPFLINIPLGITDISLPPPRQISLA